MIRLWNTLTNKKETFKPLRGKTVRLYTCGPTVYDFAHIGNLRTYVFEDILRRTLKYGRYKVNQVMNITDIDDKIIKRASAENKKPREITVPYTRAFVSDLKALNIERPETMPKATLHVKDMIALISKLLKKRYAYKGEDGSVYFDISKFKKYGKLAKLDRKNLKAGARVEADEYNKDEVRDFVLWKAQKPGEPFWNSPFGKGRPGWHIECSAMSMKYLGSSFDIHTGAVDNIFPHHENEIAQAEGATGKPFVKYWLHGEHLLVGGEKMSKSAGNFYTLRNIEGKGYDPLVFRYLTLGTHYRSKMNFTWESLEAAKNGLNNLQRLYALAKGESARNKAKRSTIIRAAETKFLEAVSDDLNMAKGLSLLWEILKDDTVLPSEKIFLAESFDRILGLNLKKVPARFVVAKETTLKWNIEGVQDLIEEREKARKNKDFGKADEIRAKINEAGYKVDDTPEGPIVVRKENG